MPTQIRPPQVGGAPRILVGVFGFVFAGAGVCMLAVIWGSDSDFVPLPGRLFGSLVCLAFLTFGGLMLISAIVGGKLMSPRIELPDLPADVPGGGNETQRPSLAAAPAAGYVCPNCGAALGEKADVSPMGDVKCAFCGRWFNVHGKNA